MKQSTRREPVIQHIRDTYGVEPEYLWADLPNSAVFRHPASKKWFAIIMDVPSNRLGLPGELPVDVMNVKCGPVMAGSLLSERGFLPAYHMNKDHWISILLDGSVPEEQVFPLLELSYDSVAPKRRTRRAQPPEKTQ